MNKLVIELEKVRVRNWWYAREKFGCGYSIEWGPYLDEKDADTFIEERQKLLTAAILATGPYVYHEVRVSEKIRTANEEIDYQNWKWGR